MKLPQSRNTDIITQELGSELVLYNLITNKAYNLNETSALIYRHCDGTTTFEEIKRKHRHLTDDIIDFALDELKQNDLIAEEYQSKFAGISRREVIKRVGLASMIALPIITSLAAPAAAQAQSGCICPSNEPAGCQNGGNYSLGCFADPNACANAGFASGGSSATPNHCCFGSNTISLTKATGCCFVICNDPPA